MTTTRTSPIFDYRALRLLMGIIAFSLAPAVTIISGDSLPSVSASYYTEAQDVFVGMLFIVGAFLWAYNGHTIVQTVMSRIASIASVLVALFPTSCESCESGATAIVHGISAIILFAILAFFCLGPFRKNVKGKSGKKKRRSVTYLVCGIIMVVAMLFALVMVLVLDKETVDTWSIIYWVEFVALSAFGVAWMVAGKSFSVIADEDEKLYLFRR